MEWLDELLSGASTWSSPSPAASFSTAAAAGHHHQDLDFVSDEVLEQLLGIDDCLDDEPLLENELLPAGGPPEPAPPQPKRRGRKPGARSSGPSITHVEAERQRRDKLNRRFFELRAAVPNVSRMDRASLLADAAAYIAQLRGRVEQLEAEVKASKQQAATSSAATTTAAPAAHSFTAQLLEVRMIGQDTAALRLTSEARHAPARLMLALRSLDLPVQHACVCRAGGVTVQDAVVDVPAAALWDEHRLRAALFHWLQPSA